MISKGGWRIRSAGFEDIPRIAETMNDERRGSGDAWLSRVAWQFVHNPWADGSDIGVLAERGDEIVGYNLAMAHPFALDGQRKVGIVSVALFVSQEHRNGILPTALGKALLARHRSTIVLATTAGPAAWGIWRHLGAIQYPHGTCRMVSAIRRLRLAALMTERALAPSNDLSARGLLSPRPSIRDVREPPWHTSPPGDDLSAASALWRSLRHEFPLTTDRAEDYLRWRYSENAPAARVIYLYDPNSLRGFYSYSVARRGRLTQARIAFLLDIVAPRGDSEAIGAMAKDFRLRARDQGACAAIARALPPGLARCFSHSGYGSRPMEDNTFYVRPPAGNGPLPTPAEWLFLISDGDAAYF